jgi:hypothetical protein
LSLASFISQQKYSLGNNPLGLYILKEKDYVADTGLSRSFSHKVVKAVVSELECFGLIPFFADHWL